LKKKNVKSNRGPVIHKVFNLQEEKDKHTAQEPQPRCVIIMLPHIATPLFCALLCLSTATALTFNDHASDDWNDVTSAFSVFDSDELYKDNSETCNACTFIGTQILNGWTKHAYKLKKWSMKKKTKKATKALTKSCVRCLSCARSLWGQRHVAFFFQPTLGILHSPPNRPTHSFVVPFPFVFLSCTARRDPHQKNPTETHRKTTSVFDERQRFSRFQRLDEKWDHFKRQHERQICGTFERVVQGLGAPVD
jgi:hypothetical protein